MSNIYQRNTIAKLNKFNIGDKIKVYDVFTCEVKYQGVIIEIEEKAKTKGGGPHRNAKVQLIDRVVTDHLCTAEKIY